MAVLAIFGAGPGIGSATAKLFAQKQYFSKIALLARNPERLDAQVEEVRKLAGDKVEIHAIPADLNDFAGLRKSLSEVEKLGPLGGIFFNAARIKPTEILTTAVEEIEEDFRTCTGALYVVAQWALPQLQKGKHDKPTFFVTNSYFPERPLPVLMSLSIGKSSQQTMMQCLDQVYGKEIHLGLIKVNGAVSDDEPNLNPKNIAEKVVALYDEGEGFTTEINP